jgi:hypothetical protein
MMANIKHTCPDCHQKYYHGEPCPNCYHTNLERKYEHANLKSGNCRKCGSKFRYVVVCNSFTVKLKPECGCWAQKAENQPSETPHTPRSQGNPGKTMG